MSHISDAAASGYFAMPGIPPGANIDTSRGSNVDPTQVGKIPGAWTGQGWVGLGKWAEPDRDQDALIRNWDAAEAMGQKPQLCIRCDNLVAIDVDVTDLTLAQAIERVICGHYASRVLDVVARRGRAPRALFPLQWAPSILGMGIPEPAYQRVTLENAIFGTDEKQVIEIKTGHRHQFVAAGVHPSTRHDYRTFSVGCIGQAWTPGPSLATRPIGSLPWLSGPSEWEQLFSSILGAAAALGWLPADRMASEIGRGLDMGELQVPARFRAQMIELVGALPNAAPEYDLYVLQAGAIFNSLGGNPDDGAYEAFETWIMRWDGNSEMDASAKWNSFIASPSRSLGWGYVVGMAKKAGMAVRWEAEALAGGTGLPFIPPGVSSRPGSTQWDALTSPASAVMRNFAQSPMNASSSVNGLSGARADAFHKPLESLLEKQGLASSSGLRPSQPHALDNVGMGCFPSAADIFGPQPPIVGLAYGTGEDFTGDISVANNINTEMHSQIAGVPMPSWVETELDPGIRAELLLKEAVYISGNDTFGLLRSGVIVKRTHLNNLYKGKTFANPSGGAEGPTRPNRVDAAELLIGSGETVNCKGISYRPGMPRIIEDKALGEGLFFNEWCVPKSWRELDAFEHALTGEDIKAGFIYERACGDWHDLLTHLVPEDNARQHILKWMAYQVQNVGAKINHTLIFIGPEGSGKNALLLPLIRWHGQAATVVDVDHIRGRFGSSVFAKRAFVFVEEIYDESRNRPIMDQIKSMVATSNDTESVVTVEQKFMPAYQIPNVVNIVCSTNHPDKLNISASDRRAMVVGEMDILPFSAEFFHRYYHEMTRDYGWCAVIAMLKGVDLSDFNPMAKPPATEAKADIIEAGRDYLEYAISEILDAKAEGLARDMIRVRDIHSELGRLPNGHPAQRVTETAIGRVLKYRLGYRRLPNPARDTSNGIRYRLWIASKQYSKYADMADATVHELYITSRNTRVVNQPAFTPGAISQFPPAARPA